MRCSEKDLKEAAARGIITRQQAYKLWEYLAEQDRAGARGLNLGNLLYYMGGLVAIGALTVFMNLGWEALGGWGLFAISCLYAAGGIFLARFFRLKRLDVPAGICSAFVIALVPLGIYGLQKGAGWWPVPAVYSDYHHQVRWHWIYMETGTLLAAAAMFRSFQYPFLLMPVSVTLWYMSMDIAPLLGVGGHESGFRAAFSTWFGLAVLLLAVTVDFWQRARREDFAFWLYLSGCAAFWGGFMSLLDGSLHGELCAIFLNILLALAGALLVRGVLVVFSAMGMTFILGKLAWTLFKNSLAFPFVLTGTGLFIIWLGMLWQKNSMKISEAASRFLTGVAREFLESRRHGRR